MHRLSLRSPIRSSFLLVALSWALVPALLGADEEESLANTLKWSTASEVDNFGYDVYRSESEEGPFERITEDPIPGAGTTDEPSRYEFADSAIDPSRDYYYYVESIALDGTREIFTPVIRAKAKRPVVVEEEAAEVEESTGELAEAEETNEESGESEAREGAAEEPNAS